MATTVNNAFSEFMKDVVNLDADVVSAARASRDNLLDNIDEFGNDEDFFDLCKSFNVQFGSFARKTKCRELDDIDLMIGISGNGATYIGSDPWDDVRIMASDTDAVQRCCKTTDGTLNSTTVVNKFKEKLGNVREYFHSDIKKDHEAIVLNLKSKVWSFDIVPCFKTKADSGGREYYLIPNGKGNWKKTDPNKDKKHITDANQEKQGRVLELIRLCKKWNKVKKTTTIPSYLLETLILNHCTEKNELSPWIDIRFMDALKYIAEHIEFSVYDLKGIQGDINTLSITERDNLKQKAETDYGKACEAISLETKDKDHQKSINKWREIFGGDFPTYG